MRALLASPVEDVTPATTLTAVVLVVASVVVLLPALVICGMCEESTPAPPSRVAGTQHGGNGQQATASSSIPVAVAPQAAAAGPTLHETEASAFDQQPRQTGVRGFRYICLWLLFWCGFFFAHSNVCVALAKWMFTTMAFTSS